MMDPKTAGELLSSCPGELLFDLYLAVFVLDMRPPILIEVIEAWKSFINKTPRVKNNGQDS